MTRRDAIPSAPFDTARLHFRAPRPADLEPLCAIWTDPEVSRFLLVPPKGRADVEARLAAMLEHAPRFGMWVFELRASGELVGRCGFYPYAGDGPLAAQPEPELAYLLARAHWGAGLASEAARGALDTLFERVQPRRAVAMVRPEHGASRRVLAKVGMREERLVRVQGVEMLLHATPVRGRAGA